MHDSSIDTCPLGGITQIDCYATLSLLTFHKLTQQWIP